MRKALITGICGQDGSYLAELLLGKGYEVHGLIRRSSSVNTTRIAAILDRVKLHEGDLLDGGSLAGIVAKVQPDECYNLAAQSFVPASFTMPDYTGEVTGIGTVRILEALRQVKQDTRFYQASTSEMFGSTPPPQSEETRFHPRSPYGVAKLYAHYISINYREAYGMFTANGILFNHEGPRRGELFVSRKIARAAARIRKGLQDKLPLGNLEARRDWGFAGDYVEAMWLMLQQEHGDDYVIATGETHSVREFLDVAFARVDLDWKKHVEVDPKFYRPSEVNDLCGDPSKARKILGWRPTMGFQQLVEHMVDAEMSALRGG
jgi:GDPmannose 4,6-dehydratase